MEIKGQKSFKEEGVVNRVKGIERLSKVQVENAFVGVRIWEVKVKFFKDCFGRTVEIEVACRRLRDRDKMKRQGYLKLISFLRRLSVKKRRKRGLWGRDKRGRNKFYKLFWVSE